MNSELDENAPPERETSQGEASRPEMPRRSTVIFSALSVLVASLTIAGSFFFTDDAFPIAPFRMFSYANNPNGVIRKMDFEAELASGRFDSHIDASEFGLRRAELEEQTAWNEPPPVAKMQSLMDAYNANHDDDIVVLRLMLKTTQLVDGVPEDDRKVEVIGELDAR